MKKNLKLLRMLFLSIIILTSVYITGFSQQDFLRDITKKYIVSKPVAESQLSISVRSLKTGKEILSHHSVKNFVPASTLKLLFTFAAVDQLGPGFQYQTNIFYTGNILEDGTLEGDILIEASGDPCFATDRFKKNKALEYVLKAILSKIVKRGIGCIDGKIIMKLPFDSYPVSGSWPLEDIGNYYASGSWGFNFMENQYKLIFERENRLNELCKIRATSPHIPGLRLKSQVFSAGRKSGDNAYIFGGPFDFYRTVMGTIPAGEGLFSIKGSIPDPPAVFLQILSGFLSENGIQNEGYGIVKTGIGNKRLLAKHRSDKMVQIAATCNDFSINLYSEALGKTLLQKNNIKIGSAYPGEADWEAVFKKYKLDKNKIKIVDACGLSPANLISSQIFTGYIFTMKGILGLPKILDILPHGGEDGHAKKFLINSSVQDRIWLKSGSIKNVLNYVGIYKSVEDGSFYAFAILSNNNVNAQAEIKLSIEKYVEQLVLHTSQ